MSRTYVAYKRGWVTSKDQNGLRTKISCYNRKSDSSYWATEQSKGVAYQVCITSFLLRVIGSQREFMSWGGFPWLAVSLILNTNKIVFYFSKFNFNIHVKKNLFGVQTYSMWGQHKSNLLKSRVSIKYVVILSEHRTYIITKSPTRR